MSPRLNIRTSQTSAGSHSPLGNELQVSSTFQPFDNDPEESLSPAPLLAFQGVPYQRHSHKHLIKAVLVGQILVNWTGTRKHRVGRDCCCFLFALALPVLDLRTGAFGMPEVARKVRRRNDELPDDSGSGSNDVGLTGGHQEVENAVDKVVGQVCPTRVELEDATDSLQSVLKFSSFVLDARYTRLLTARLLPVKPPARLSRSPMSNFKPPLIMNSTTKSPSLMYFCKLNRAILSDKTFLPDLRGMSSVRDDSLVKTDWDEAVRKASTTAKASVIGDAHNLPGQHSLLPKKSITHLRSTLDMTRCLRLLLVIKRSPSSRKHNVI
jgi:hypothetical protein